MTFRRFDLAFCRRFGLAVLTCRRSGESVALLVARRANNQPTIGRLRVRGLLNTVG